MKTYSVTIKFTTDYLQARFSEDAKKELENYVSKGIIKSEEDSWKVFLHEDDKGIYIPNIQLRNALINAGRNFKMKKRRSSLKDWVVSNIMVSPDKIYIGKTKPDQIIVSYPSRKDGNRVTTKHPAFDKGMEVQYEIVSLHPTMENKPIEELVKDAGKSFGIGARRRDLFGRFELKQFNLV